MQWLSQNGFFVLLIIAFVAMHLFGHGGHGGHSGHGRRRPADNRGEAGPGHDHGDEAASSPSRAPHDHGDSEQPAGSAQDKATTGRHEHRGGC